MIKLKKQKLNLTFCALLCTLCGPAFAAPTATPEAGLQQGFVKPPASAQPLAWWHWMNGNVTKVGITADLESMKRVGIAGATIMNVANKAAVDIPAGPVDYMSPQWLDMVEYSAQEAERLGLELGMANAAGWSGSGGPWITPENSMKKLVWSEVTVAAETAPGIVLRQPKAERNFYRDIAVLAFPAAQGKTIALKDILDVSSKMDASGRLDWQPAAGRWTVLRFGYTTNGEENRPAPESATGLECDKLSRSALDAFWAGGIQPVLDRLGPLAGKVFNTILLDSYEAGAQDWTADMGGEFLRRRGYELKLYLPALAGRVINSSAETDRFQWDFKRTISDLFTDNYYGYFAEKCEQAGLQFACEPYGGRFFDTLA